ncbi:MAG: Toxin-antitoxin protein [Parcubacteria group bacterium GW2011_GWA2_47_12]|nr:MAG: Toxin-antitoxin protein [Parcubacteria group bacterium GW2011_GWA2_47_12]
MHKDFDGWNSEKKRRHNEGTQRLFHEREIWWCAFGINIGREQDGRMDNFERPIVILKKLSPDTLCVLPLSTKKKLEKFQAEIIHQNVYGFALLDQIRVLDSKRLLRKIGKIDISGFLSMKRKLSKVLL